MADRIEITPKLQNAKITVPAPEVDSTGVSHWYLDNKQKSTATSVTLKADTGYTFESDGSLDYQGSYNSQTEPIPASHTDAITFKLPDLDWYDQYIPLVVTMSATKDTPTTPPTTPTEPKVNQVDLVPTLQNAKVIVPAPIVDDNSTTHYYLDPKHTTVTLKATDGYTFENDGSLDYQKTEYLSGTLVIKATHTDTVTFSLPTDLDWDAQFRFDLTMGAVKGQVAESSGGFTNIYKADYTNLLKFSSEMIVKIQGGYGGAIKAYDVTPYINNLVMLPFNIPTGEQAPIVAGSETFTTQLPTVDDSYLTVDLGKITVDEQYKNAFDYYQVKARLMLPYTSMIDLDVKHVINKTIAIKYIVNVVNGDTTINLYNDTDLFYSNQVNLASEIPFINNVSDASQYVVINQLKTLFRNDIHQAYIIIEQPTPVLNSDYYSTDEKGTLQGYTGDVKVRLLNNLDINVAELNALQNLLETGVKIK